MRRWLVVFLLALGAAATVAVAYAAAAPANGDRGGLGGRYGGGRGYFAVVCGFSHRNQDDPIVFFNQPGRSHDHTYFGNEATKGELDARRAPRLGRDDVPAARRHGRLLGSDALRRGPGDPTARRDRLLHSAHARARAGLSRRTSRSSRAPRRRARRRGRGSRTGAAADGAFASRRDPDLRSASSLRLVVNFPNCWDGSRLDSADHKSHLAYSTNGVCPSTHPAEVPALTLEVYYGVAGGPTAELASGGDFSGHADFMNAWNQPTLERLVDRYLNRSRGRR